MKWISAIALSLLASASAAYECRFTTECFEVDSCSESDLLADVLVADKVISTEFGDITIVAIREQSKLVSIFGSGEGAEYLLSITPEAARLSTHMNEGPLAVHYLGTCEGAF